MPDQPWSPGAAGNVLTAALPPLTMSQREVVLETDAHLLVAAGAGSGKTSTVVQAICQLLGAAVRDEEGHVHQPKHAIRLSDIAAITFTNQAAADLKRKLRAALKTSGLAALAADVDTARIGTIHGFCGDVLRDFALRAGLPPSSHILDEGTARGIVGECAEAALLEAATSRGAEALAPLTRGRPLRDVIEAIETLASDRARLASYASRRSTLRVHEQLLLELAEQATALRIARLQADGAYDFDHLIVETRDLLRANTEVRHAAQRQIRVLIIDEFQDVDPAQRDIALLLGGLEQADPMPSRIMLVGDPKQSIFRFRRADVSLWNDVARRFSPNGSTQPATGRVIELRENFRSRQGILAFVDGVIGPTLERPVHPDGTRQPFEVPYQALDARSATAAGDRCVEMLCVPPRDDGKTQNADTVRRVEAQAVAQRIVELVADGRRHGDMALLLSGWSAVDYYEAALRAAGIPVYVLRSGGFWECREVVDCLLALRAIRDTLDPVGDLTALTGFLKSPFVGVRDDTLLALASQTGGWREALATESRERALLDRAQQLLTRFRALRDRIPLSTLLERLLLESGYLAMLAQHPGTQAQAIGNVRKLLRITAERGDVSLGEWLREVEETRVRGDEVPQERLYRERADVVTITSIHSAKGLEWPVVFWCDLVRGAPSHRSPLVTGREQFCLEDVQLLDAKGDVDDPLFDAARADEALERRAESIRLWYVAATRARELLVLSGVPLGTGKRASVTVDGLLWEHYAALAADPVPSTLAYAHRDGTAYELVVRVAEAVPTDAGDDAEHMATLRAHRDAAAAHHVHAPPPAVRVPMGRTRLSATQLMRFAESPDSWWQRYAFGFVASDYAMASPRSATVDDGMAPRDWALEGTIVHDVLERYAFEVDDIEELIDQAIERHDPDAMTDGYRPSYRGRIRALVDGAVGSAAWHQAASRPSARRELRFTRVLPDGSTIEGALDLASVADDVSELLDVKTGAAAGGEMAAGYAVQGATYVEATQAIAAGRAARFALLPVHDGEALSVNVDAARVPALVMALRQSEPPSGGSGQPSGTS